MLYAIFKRSSSIEEFKQIILANELFIDDRGRLRGWPLNHLIEAILNDPESDGKDFVIEILADLFSHSRESIAKSRMNTRLEREIEQRYAEFLYEDSEEYLQATYNDIEASYGERLAA